MDKASMLAYLGGIVRVATSIIGGYLAQKGLATQAETEGLAGAAVVVGTGLWSIWAKRKALLTPPPGPSSTLGVGRSMLSVLLFLLLPSSLILCNSGCVGMSEKKIAAAGKIADSYYNSANVAELWTVTSSNGNGKVTFENFSTFTMNTPVPPKNIIPREPTFWEGAWDTVKTLGPWAFFGYALGGGGLANHTSTTVNNAPATP